jgi:hypothetical protein
MARLGTFDPQLEPRAWFDDNALPEGWFANDLIPAPSSSTYTLVADGATYSYFGNNVNFITSLKLAADGGVYSYSGNNANTLFNRRLVADGGIYSYSGNNANTLFNGRLIADGDTYAYSGDNANLVYATAGAFTLIADGGVYSYAGNNANLVYTPTAIVVFDTHDGDRHRKRIRKVRDERELRREQVITAYETLLEVRPEEATRIVSEFAAPVTTLRAPSVDFDALLADLDAVDRLYEAYLEMDDEEVLMLI